MNKNFETWMVEVDRRLVVACSMGVDDLPDYSYRDAFDAGISASEVADEALDNAGWSF